MVSPAVVHNPFSCVLILTMGPLLKNTWLSYLLLFSIFYCQFTKINIHPSILSKQQPHTPSAKVYVFNIRSLHMETLRRVFIIRKPVKELKLPSQTNSFSCCLWLVLGLHVAAVCMFVFLCRVCIHMSFRP